jgi:CheY-like chemotaxis protein
MSRHILLIDDDVDDIELFKEALFEADPHSSLEFFNDAGQLLTQFNSLPIMPDIIFLDINMATISGWDCLHFLKENNYLDKIPVIMYSTSSHKKEVQQALNEGAWGFVTKPSSYRDLIEMLKQVIGTPKENLRQLLGKN